MGLAWACSAGAKTVPVVSAAPPATEYFSSVRRSMRLCVGRLVILVLPEPSACLVLRSAAAPCPDTGRRSAVRDLRGGVPQCQRHPPHRWPRTSGSLPAAPLATLATLQASPYRLPPSGTR